MRNWEKITLSIVTVLSLTIVIYLLAPYIYAKDKDKEKETYIQITPDKVSIEEFVEEPKEIFINPTQPEFSKEQEELIKRVLQEYHESDKKVPVEDQPYVDEPGYQDLSDEAVIEYIEANKVDNPKPRMTAPSGLTLEGLNAFLKGSPLQGYAIEFFRAELKYGVSAGLMASMANTESSLGFAGRIAIEKNNLFGFMAYDKDPWGNSKGFKSFAECIDVVSNYVATHYMVPEGKHYIDGTIRGMGRRWASSDHWGELTTASYNRIIRKVKETQ